MTLFSRWQTSFPAKNLQSEVAKAGDCSVTAEVNQRPKDGGRTNAMGTTARHDAIQIRRSLTSWLNKSKHLNFHGYLRSGVGLNSEGGQMVAFQAPVAPAKYRLGNEAETYGEMIFVNNWINPSHDPDKAWMKTEVLVQANTTELPNLRQQRSVPAARSVHSSGECFIESAAWRSSGRENATTGGSTSTSTTSSCWTQAATARLREPEPEIRSSGRRVPGRRQRRFDHRYRRLPPKSVLDARLYGIKLGEVWGCGTTTRSRRAAFSTTARRCHPRRLPTGSGT